MKEREFIRLRREIRADYHKKIEALELVWRMLNESAPPPDPKKKRPKAENPPSSQDGGQAHTQTAAQIKSVLGLMDGQFTRNDVLRALRKQGIEANSSTVSHTLKRIESRGEIVLLSKGAGKRATVYCHPGQEPAPASPSPPAASPLRANLLDDDDDVQVVMSTTDQHDRIRALAKELELDVNFIKTDLILGRFGVQKLVELTAQQADELVDLMKQSAIAR